jgi:hypothetical protein
MLRGRSLRVVALGVARCAGTERDSSAQIYTERDGVSVHARRWCGAGHATQLGLEIHFQSEQQRTRMDLQTLLQGMSLDSNRVGMETTLLPHSSGVTCVTSETHKDEIPA